MLRIKRTIEAEFANKNFVSGILEAAQSVGSAAITSNLKAPVTVSESAPTETTSSQPVGAMALLGQKRRQKELEEEKKQVSDFEIAELSVPDAVFGDAKKQKT